MDELVKQLLEKYLSDYREYHLFLLICFAVIIALFQIIQFIYVSKRIEAFKNELKKSEIKFSTFNQLQINALRKIYHLIIKFELTTKILYNTSTKNLDHQLFEKRINKWLNDFFESKREFENERILLTKVLKELYTETYIDFEKIKKLLINEKEQLDYLEQKYQGDLRELYQFSELESEEIVNKINKISKELSIEKSLKNFEKLKTEIENVFIQMN
jgi:hypothetical protein